MDSRIVMKPLVIALSAAFAVTAFAAGTSATTGSHPGMTSTTTEAGGPQFSDIDKDGDNKISQQELSDWVRNNFSAWDKDNNNQLSQQEFQHLMGGTAMGGTAGGAAGGEMGGATPGGSGTYSR